MTVFATVSLARFAVTGPHPIIVRILLGVGALVSAVWIVVGAVRLRAALAGRDIANSS